MCTWTVAGPLGPRLGFFLTLFIGPQIHKTPTTAINGKEAQKNKKKTFPGDVGRQLMPGEL